MIKTRFFLFILVLSFFFSSVLTSCESLTKSVQTKPVKNNVLKEYINTPLDKAKGMKAKVESKQEEARIQLLEDN